MVQFDLERPSASPGRNPEIRPRAHQGTRGVAGSVLLLGNYRPTITIARTLDGQGFHVIVGLGDRGGAEFSRAVDEVWDHPQVERAPEQFHEALESFLERRPDITIVYPVAETYVRFLAEVRSTLPENRLYVLADSAAVLAALDKEEMFARAERLAVPVARLQTVTSYPGLLATLEAIGFPVVLRPLSSKTRLLGRKAIVIGSAADLAALLPAWPQGHEAILVQRQVTGLRHNQYFAAASGRLLRLSEAVILRTDRPDGTGLAVEGRTISISPDLAHYTRSLVSDLKYSGVGCAQYMVDRARGALTFLEINPRIAGNHAVPEAAGLGLSRLAIDIAAGDAHNEPYSEGREGLLYAWTHGDLRGLAGALWGREVSFREALRWGVRLIRLSAAADLHMTWSWRDPMPTLGFLARQIAQDLRRTIRRSDARPKAAVRDAVTR